MNVNVTNLWIGKHPGDYRFYCYSIRYVGVGEQKEDLLPFDPEQFIESLFR